MGLRTDGNKLVVDVATHADDGVVGVVVVVFHRIEANVTNVLKVLDITAV